VSFASAFFESKPTGTCLAMKLQKQLDSEAWNLLKKTGDLNSHTWLEGTALTKNPSMRSGSNIA
jgi:hypothetical protein